MIPIPTQTEVLGAALTGAAGTGALAMGATYYWIERMLSGDTPLPMKVRPEDLGLPYEKVEFTTSDGLTLRGWFVPAQAPSRRTILLCHGYSANKGAILEGTSFLRARGFNLLYFDFRGCGENAPATITVGFLEAADFDAAVGWLKTRRPQDALGVYGVSMGAMVSFCGLARHRELKAAVLESVFPSHNTAVVRYVRVKYPGLDLMSPLGFWWLRRRLGADPEVSSPERVAGAIGPRPILAINGGADAVAPAKLSRALLEKVAGPTEYWVVPGARHAKCAELGGAAYRERLASFFDRHL